VAQQVLRQLGHYNGDTARFGFIVAHLRGQPDNPAAGGGDVGRVANRNAFHWPISTA